MVVVKRGPCVGGMLLGQGFMQSWEKGETHTFNVSPQLKWGHVKWRRWRWRWASVEVGAVGTLIWIGSGACYYRASGGPQVRIPVFSCVRCPGNVNSCANYRVPAENQ